MYVDIVACRRGRVRVDVNLVKNGACKPAPVPVIVPVAVKVPLAVRLAEKTADELPEMTVQTLELADEEPIVPVEEEIKTPEELEQMASETINSIDEILAASDVEEVEGELEDVVSGALDELDSMSRRADDMMESLNDQLAEALDEINDSTDENSEQFNSTIQECIDSVESAISQREAETARDLFDEPEVKAENEADIDPFDEPEVKAENEADIDPFDELEVKVENEADIDPFDEPEDKGNSYIRYFNRDEQGERVEVDDKRADGQEVVCFNEENGKLSRVCGIIKKDSSKDGELIVDEVYNIIEESNKATDLEIPKKEKKESKKKGKKKH